MFKKGDKVFSILKGWGKIVDDAFQGEGFIRVQFDKGGMFVYYNDGKYFESDLYPELYHTEPTITVPKRRVEHKGWIGIENADAGNLGRNTTCIYGNKDEILPIVDDWNKGATIQEITFYTEE